MKKFLFATTAIIAAGAITTDAKAAEPVSLSISGFMEQWIGYAGNDEDVSEAQGTNPGELHASVDSEIHFKASTTLDNGISFSGTVELETSDNGGAIDESSMTISGGFGAVTIGANDSAAGNLFAGGPGAGMLGYDDGDFGNWLEIPANIGLSSPDTMRTLGSDSRKVLFIAPRVAGFQVGVSFAPQGSFNGDGTGDQNANTHNILSTGLNYAGEFGGASVEVGAGYEIASGANRTTTTTTTTSTTLTSAGGVAVGDTLTGTTTTTTATTSTSANDSDITSFGIGGSVGFGNITVGGAYGIRETETGTSTDTEDTSYSVGLAYSMGDASVSLGYAFGDTDDGTNTDEISVYELGATYALGAGVDWAASLAFVDFDTDEAGLASGVGDGQSWVLATGFDLAF